MLIDELAGYEVMHKRNCYFSLSATLELLEFSANFGRPRDAIAGRNIGRKCKKSDGAAVNGVMMELLPIKDCRTRACDIFTAKLVMPKS